MKVLNKYHGNCENAINVTRPSKWGNPFVIGRDGTREEVVVKFEEYLLHNSKLMLDLGELKGKDLVCCCAPKPCHGDVLLKYANISELEQIQELFKPIEIKTKTAGGVTWVEL